MIKLDEELKSREAQSETLQGNKDQLQKSKEEQPENEDAEALEDKLANLQEAYELNEGTISDLKAFVEKYEHFLEQERRRIALILDEIDRITQECEQWQLPQGPAAKEVDTKQEKQAKTKSAPSAGHPKDSKEPEPKGKGKKGNKSKAAGKGDDSPKVNGEERAVTQEQAPENAAFAEDYVFQGGEQLGEHFEVLAPIDQGKFGQVVKCVDVRSKKKTYAAKISKNVVEEVENAKVEV